MAIPVEPTYGLVSNDRHPGVRVGAEVTYTLVRTNIVVGGSGKDETIAATADEIAAKFPLGHPYTQDAVVAPRAKFMVLVSSVQLRAVAKPSGFPTSTDVHSATIEWLMPGSFTVQCLVDIPEPWAGGKKRRVVVSTVQDVYTDAQDRANVESHASWLFNFSGIPEVVELTKYPERLAIELFRELRTYDEIEKQHPTVLPDQKDEFEQIRAQKKKLGNNLYDLVIRASAHVHNRYVISGLHGAARDNVPLNLVLAVARRPRVDRFQVHGEPPTPPSKDTVFLYQVQLIDWTDASGPAYSGNYGGIHHNKARAIVMALANWADSNNYPPGPVEFELPPPIAEALRAGFDGGRITADQLEELGIDPFALVPGNPVRGSFDVSDGPSAADIFDGVAFAAASLAFVAAGIAPVPGSRAVAGLIWASVIAGTAASTIRIVGRHQQGVIDWKADAIDGLGIIGNLLMVPGAKQLWQQGSKLVLRDVAIIGAGNAVVRRTLVAQIGVDVIQGVLIAAEEIDGLQKVLADTTKHPIDRVQQAMGTITRLIGTGALIAINVRGNVADIGHLQGGGGDLMRRNAGKLTEADDTLDLQTGPGSKGNTKDGGHHTKADLDPASTKPAPNPPPRLTVEAEAKLGTLDDAQKAQSRKMLDADEQAANALFVRFGTDALTHADAFEAVWERWRKLDYGDEMLRTYTKHTGTDGFVYFARQADGTAGDLELLAGGWAATREEHFQSLFPKAGHSVGRHGPHVPEAPGEKLELRVKTGIAPDGVPSITERSTRFDTFADWLEAHDSAYLELGDRFGLDMHTGPIVANNGSISAQATGYVQLRDLNNPGTKVTRSMGEGYQGVSDGTQHHVTLNHPDGSTRSGVVYPSTVRVSRSEIDHFFVTLGWTGREWIVIQLFPAKLRSPNTQVGLQRQSINQGAGTI